MFILPTYSWIIVVAIVLVVFFKGTAHKLSCKLNESDVKEELANVNEQYLFTKRASWLLRVSSKETRLLNRRLKYLGKLRKKAAKRFGYNSGQVALIDRWMSEVRQYIDQFSNITHAAFNMPIGV